MSNVEKPKPIYNRPGLPAIVYRIGDYNSFRQRLLAQLSDEQVPGDTPQARRPLAKLSTRSNEDPAIALLDAWAVVADVLTFYQERIANEGYLRTATERRSVLELARTIGYELSPGVAASTYLAFTVDDTPGGVTQAIIPQGTPVMSIPSKEDELPQTFETSAEILAHLEWNSPKPRLIRPQKITEDIQQIYLGGINTQLQPGDWILLIGNQEQDIKTYLLNLTAVETFTEENYTLVTWEKEKQLLSAISGTLRNSQIFAFRNFASLFGKNAPKWEDMPDEIKKDKGGTVCGGIFRSDDNGSNWTPKNEGLPNTDILCLATNQPQKYLFAGTPDRGIFRTQDEGENWEAVNAGLTNLSIQTLYIEPQRGHVFAGTPGGGVFRSKDNGENWVPIHTGSVRVEGQNGNNWESVNTGIPNTVVRSLLTYTPYPGNSFTGTISSSDNNKQVTGSDTSFSKELRVGDIIIAAGQGRIVTAVNSNTELTVNSAFRPHLPQLTTFSGGTYIFVGTDQGIYRSVDQGKNWYLKGLSDKVVRALLACTNLPVKPGTGTITSSNTTVTGNETKFNTELRVDDLIAVAGQTRIITAITSDTELTVDRAFSSNITNQTFFISVTYIFAGTDNGVYRSDDYGNRWIAINTSLSNTNVTSLLTNGNHIFTGTIGGGVYRSDNYGNRWFSHPTATGTISTQGTTVTGTGTSFNNQLREGDAIAVAGQTRTITKIDSDNSLTIDTAFVPDISEPSNFTIGLTNPHVTSLALSSENQIIAGTAGGGIFRSTDSSDRWQPINQGLTTHDITSLAVNATGKLFAGSLFSGFKQEDWPNFEVTKPPIDLDTLYPRILEDSWIVLLDENLEQNQRHFQAFQVDNISADTRSKFNLESEITTIRPKSDPNKPIDLKGFRRRYTQVMVESEALTLAPEQLTVTVQQEQIFLDPINQDQVFLGEFVPDLESGKTLIVSGKHVRAIVKDIGGFFTWNPSTSTWERNNQGLTNTSVSALAINPKQVTEYYLGTEKGVFRFPDGGTTWEPLNEGLTDTNEGFTDINVQALLIHPSRKEVFIGTPRGILRYSEINNNWEAKNEGLVHKNVQALVIDPDEIIFAGTSDGGVFVSRNNGDSWSPTSLANADIQTLAVNPVTKDVFAGSFHKGIFRSLDGGNTWQQLTNIERGTGTISSDDTTVQGVGLNLAQLQEGDILNAGGQSRTIVATDEETQILTVNSAFRPDLPEGTPFTINTGLTNLNITSLLIVPQPGEGTILFAGSAGSGIFRSQDYGQRWEQINTKLDDLEIRTLAVNSSNEIFVGTARKGVYRSTNNGELWAPINNGLTNTDVKAIAISRNTATNTDTMIAGGNGILISEDGFYTTPLQLGDLLWVISPPYLKEGEANYNWLVRDINEFVGIITTTTDKDLYLQPANDDDRIVSEVCTIKNPPTDQQNPVITLAKPLKYAYDPETVVIYGNVVMATHGETLIEVMGSGDGSIPNQSFILKKPPLTYVPAPIASGAKSTLEVRVDDVLWSEVDTLYQKDAQLQGYIIRLTDDSTPIVTFGDGENGARLHTGEENVTATYRSGIGLEGQVGAESLTLIKKRPLGIVEVTNPLAATGAAPPESRDQGREKAPSKIRTLDRIVSLQDFEDFARAFAGIGKAQAVPLWNGQGQLVHITVAAVDGSQVDANTNLYKQLVAAIDSNRDPVQLVQVDSYELQLFNVEAKLQFDPRYESEKLIAEVTTALKTKFAFANRSFGQDVTASEIIATIQGVEGVVAVDLDFLYKLGTSKGLEQSLTAALAQWDEDNNRVLPAQLLLLNSKDIKLTAVPVL